MAISYTYLAPLSFIADGIAMFYSQLADPMISSGLIDGSNLKMVPQYTQGGYVSFRADIIKSGTGFNKDKQKPTTFTFVKDVQVTTEFVEAHNKPNDSNEGILLNCNHVDKMLATQATRLQGLEYVRTYSKLSASAVYSQYLSNVCDSIYGNMFIRNTGTGNVYEGTSTTFDTDVTNAFHLMTTDLTAAETTRGANGDKLDAEVNGAASVFTTDGTGRTVWCLLPQAAYTAFRMAINRIPNANSQITYGAANRDGVMISPYQIWFNYNGITYVNMGSALPTGGTTTPYTRGLLLTKDAIEIAVVQRPLESSISYLGNTVSGGGSNVGYNADTFMEMMAQIPGTNPNLPRNQADEQVRPSILRAMMSGGGVDSSRIIGCMASSLERMGLGLTNAGHYNLFCQMWSTAIRKNNHQLREFRINDSLIPATTGVVMAPATTKGV